MTFRRPEPSTNDVLTYRADMAQLQDSDYDALQRAKALLVTCANTIKPLERELSLFLEGEKAREEWRQEVLSGEQRDSSDS